MKDSIVFVVIDSDGDDRTLDVAPDKSTADFDTAADAHAAIDRHQQRGNEIRYLPWTVVERTQKVLGSYRRTAGMTAFVEAPAFVPTES